MYFYFEAERTTHDAIQSYPPQNWIIHYGVGMVNKSFSGSIMHSLRESDGDGSDTN